MSTTRIYEQDQRLWRSSKRLADRSVPLDRAHFAVLKEYLRLFFKHRWLIAAVFIVTAVTGTIWTFLQTPIYQASATVLIEPELPKVLNIQEVTSPGLGTLEYYRTQYAARLGAT